MTFELPDRLISIDAECNGLAGRAFAVAMTLSDPDREIQRITYRCPIDVPVDDWVAENVLPAIDDMKVDCADYPELLDNLRATYLRWCDGDSTAMVGHVVWPVEARLLLDVFPGKTIWVGPYPLIDVASVLLAKGRNPLSVDDYLKAHAIPAPEGAPHHPLYDARAAERCLRHLMGGPE